jgi:hypothetical protein
MPMQLASRGAVAGHSRTQRQTCEHISPHGDTVPPTRGTGAPQARTRDENPGLWLAECRRGGNVSRRPAEEHAMKYGPEFKTEAEARGYLAQSVFGVVVQWRYAPYPFAVLAPDDAQVLQAKGSLRILPGGSLRVPEDEKRRSG